MMIRRISYNTSETFLIAQGQPNLLSNFQGPGPSPSVPPLALSCTRESVSWAQAWTSQAADKSQTTNHTNSCPVARSQAQRCTFLWVPLPKTELAKGPTCRFWKEAQHNLSTDSEVSSTKSMSWGCRVGSGCGNAPLALRRKSNRASKTWVRAGSHLTQGLGWYDTA